MITDMKLNLHMFDISRSLTVLPLFSYLEQKKLFIFGGSTKDGITNDLWEFNTLTKAWNKVGPSNKQEPVGVIGHASVAVGNKMYVFMGFSTDRSYFSGVQQFDMGNIYFKLFSYTIIALLTPLSMKPAFY